MSRTRSRITVISLVGLCFVVLLGMMSSASALTVTITPLTQDQWSGSIPNNPDANDIATIVGYSPLYELYKQDVGGPETGPYAGSYDTVFSNTPLDPEDAQITYIGGPSISGSPLYLLVKDGNHTPIWYIFNLSDLQNVQVNGGVVANYSWNGTDTIYLGGFWTGTGPAGAGAISHVSIYGPTAIPEPGILILLGIGITAAGVASRWIRRI